MREFSANTPASCQGLDSQAKEKCHEKNTFAFTDTLYSRLVGCGNGESPTSNGGSGQNVAFADTEWAVYDGYGVTMEYPSTWTLYCYAESASAANYSVLMVSAAEDIFLRCYVTESDPLPVTILSPSDNAEAKLFYEHVQETAFRAVDFPIMDPAAAMEGDEAVIEFMTALEEYNADPKNPLPEYTGELPQGQSGTMNTVQLSDDGTLASVQDADTGLYGYIDKTGAWRIEPQFQSAYGFSDGRAMVQLEDGSWAYIDRTGARLSPEVRDSRRKHLSAEEFRGVPGRHRGRGDRYRNRLR